MFFFEDSALFCFVPKNLATQAIVKVDTKWIKVICGVDISKTLKYLFLMGPEGPAV